jgi:ribosomal protein S12 methylthiotransferase
LSGQLELSQFEIIDKANDADVIIVNTCGFIEDAKEESLQAIFEALKLKEASPNKKVFVTGCLSERYKEAIQDEIPEVDAVFGTEAYTEILESLGKKHAAEDNLALVRKLSTPKHLAYLKISEGCNHNCSFCAIPGIRGRQRSRTLESLIEEAIILTKQGVKELVLISQDTSSYGVDIYGKQKITELLHKLSMIEQLKWIRVLYWYPTNFPLEVLDLMKKNEKIINYIDMPIQHISKNMLQKMRRGNTRESLVKIFNKMKDMIPDITLRTTLITGHPGESETDFNELLEFIKAIKFDRVGVFTYSDEEGTHSYNLTDKVEAAEMKKRRDKIMQAQSEISLAKNMEMVGSVYDVLIDEYEESIGYYGRTYKDAPEVDNEVFIALESDANVKVGEIYPVRITEAGEYDLKGIVI